MTTATGLQSLPRARDKLEVPHTSTELLDAMRGFGAFLGDPRMRQTITRPHGLVPVVLPEPVIFAIFGGGYLGVMVIFWLMYRHTYRKRELGILFRAMRERRRVTAEWKTRQAEQHQHPTD